MSNHICQKCGADVECHARDLGGGRKRPLNEFNANHQTLLSMLEKNPMHWYTVLDLFFLVRDVARIARVGKRTYFLDSDVQNGLSDLVGWGNVEMRKVSKSRKFMYRWVKGRS